MIRRSWFYPSGQGHLLGAGRKRKKLSFTFSLPHVEWVAYFKTSRDSKKKNKKNIGNATTCLTINERKAACPLSGTCKESRLLHCTERAQDLLRAGNETVGSLAAKELHVLARKYSSADTPLEEEELPWTASSPSASHTNSKVTEGDNAGKCDCAG